MRWFLLMSLVAFSAVAEEAVTVEKTKVTVEYKRFDPEHLPDPAPPLHHYDGEDKARRRARRRKFWMPASVIA